MYFFLVKTGDTALHAAIENNHKNVFDFLVSHGANVNGIERCTSPLQVAAELGKADLVTELLARGAKPDHLDSKRQTALHLAVKSGDIETVKILLRQKMNLKTLDFHSMSCFDYAATLGHYKIMELLLNCKKFVSERILNSALSHAAECGHADVVELLLKNGATLKSSEDCEWYEEVSALHLAARNGHDRVVKTLLDFKADVNARDASSMTPLECAALYAQLSTMKLLIERGAIISSGKIVYNG